MEILGLGVQGAGFKSLGFIEVYCLESSGFRGLYQPGASQLSWRDVASQLQEGFVSGWV